MKKVILITGGSRGIGAATVQVAAREGYNICLNYVQNKTAAEETATLARNSGVEVLIHQADVSREDDVLQLFKAIDDKWGVLHALVNNAGTLETQTGILGLDADRLTRIFSKNVTSAFICAREAVKRMSTNTGGPGGAIVNVSSVAARTGSPGEYTDYAAAKAAMDALTIGLSKEVADQGIRVNAVRPGFIYTDIHADGGEAGRVDRLAPGIPMKRGGQPAEVAEAIMWLVSDKSSYTTGSFVELSGGR